MKLKKPVARPLSTLWAVFYKEALRRQKIGDLETFAGMCLLLFVTFNRSTTDLTQREVYDLKNDINEEVHASAFGSSLYLDMPHCWGNRLAFMHLKSIE